MSSPFKLDHVALGLRRMSDGLPLVRDLLGGVYVAEMPEGVFRWTQWRFANGGVLELLEPDGPPGGFLHRFLEARGPGFHHVTFKVPDLAAAAARAEGLGYGIVGYNDSQPMWKEAFVHPKQAMGIVVQLAESHENWPAPADPADAASILALRLVARDPAAARRLWGELLGGSESDQDGTLCFRWPDSPIAVRVELDAQASDDRPRRLEIGCERRLDLRDGSYPELGATFVQVGAQGGIA
jgi:methylmalonyl-CoA/ethylmalonyl-CoA epimerase